MDPQARLNAARAKARPDKAPRAGPKLKRYVYSRAYAALLSAWDAALRSHV